MTNRLGGKVALITGGAGGIGQACAVRFAEEGADIAVADIKACEETVALVEAQGRKVIALEVDTTSDAACEAMIEQTVSHFGRVDVGVMSAGLLHPPVPVAELETAAFQRIIDVNLTGVMRCARALACQLLKQGTGGSIINIASSAGHIPLAGSGPYCVSKAGVIMLTKVMALELAETGIRVNAVGPGFTSTAMWNPDADSDLYRWAMEITPMKRNGTPREQADACLYFASQESSFTTGQVLFPAGGQFTG